MIDGTMSQVIVVYSTSSSYLPSYDYSDGGAILLNDHYYDELTSYRRPPMRFFPCPTFKLHCLGWVPFTLRELPRPLVRLRSVTQPPRALRRWPAATRGRRPVRGRPGRRRQRFLSDLF
jgi:hypothetical protein